MCVLFDRATVRLVEWRVIEVRVLGLCVRNTEVGVEAKGLGTVLLGKGKD